MKSQVTLNYSLADLQPPVYVVTSLSEPQWEPVEMSFTQKGDGQFEFYKDFEAEEGEHQYKFRLGPGDWWALDETKHIVDDGSGNRNNLMVIEKPRKDSILPVLASAKPNMPERHLRENVIEQPQLEVTDVDSTEEPREPNVDMSDADHEAEPDNSPLLRHESNLAHIDETATVQHDMINNDDAEGPLMAHESPTGHTSEADPESDRLDHEPSIDTQSQSATHTTSQEEEGAPLFRHESRVEAVPVHENDLDDDFAVAPLFRHESSTSLYRSEEESTAPLFRHESIDYDSDQQPQYSRSFSAAMDPLDRQDSVKMLVEKLPTDHEGILEHLRRASTRVSDEDVLSSPSVLARSVSSASQASGLQLDAINESEEEPAQVEMLQTVSESDDFSSILAAAAADRDGKLNLLLGKQTFNPHVNTHKHQQSRSAITELLTPPMTPEMQQADVADEGHFAPFPTETQQSEIVENASQPEDFREEANPTEAAKTGSSTILDHHASSLPEFTESNKASPAPNNSPLKSWFAGISSFFRGIFGTSAGATSVVALAVGVAAALYRWRDTRETIASGLLGAAYPHANGVRRDDGPGIMV